MTPPEPQPVYFGAGLFGWLHRPGTEAAVDIGLVICNPFGFEEVCAHRSLRELAIAAASAGFPTLRFDYAGCGNSAGDEFQADMLGRWQRSVHEAVEGLKQASGVRGVCLLGLRLGALLATLAANERSDVAGLVLIAPVVRGRAYLRELTALAQTGAGTPMDVAPDGPLESAGFLMSAETRDALARLDLQSLDRAPAARMLIVERDDLPSAAPWAAALEQLGAGVAVALWPGYSRMMDDPQRAQVPQEIIDGVTQQLSLWRGSVARVPTANLEWGASSQQVAGNAATASQQLCEMAVQVDSGQTKMFGVLTRSVADSRQRSPAVLMLSAGSVHAIGPNRLWVRLARRWAARGMTVLRLDVSGIGDSPPRRSADQNVVYSRYALDDVAAGLRYLKSQPTVGECHVVGLCSGAYHAFKAAVAGQAVASAVMINPLTYFWQDGDRLSDVNEYEIFELTSRYSGKFFTAEPWHKLIRGELDLRLILEVVLRRLWNVVASYVFELARLLHLPLRNDLARELDTASRHGIALRFVFAAGAPGFALLRKQSGNAIARLQARKVATLDFVIDADHTFTHMRARERLVQVLERRMWTDHGVDDETA